MNNKKLLLEESNIRTAFGGYFHEDWDFTSLCPLEAIRLMIYDSREDVLFSVVESMCHIRDEVRDDRSMSLLLDRLDLNVSYANYGQTPCDFFSNMLDFILYVCKKEKGIFLGSYVKDRGEAIALFPQCSEQEKIAREGYSFLLKMISVCFVDDCIALEGIGYGQKIRNYFGSISIDERLLLDKEMRALYRCDLGVGELKCLLENGFLLRYNLDYYGFSAKGFLIAVIEVLYYHLPMEKREIFEW